MNFFIFIVILCFVLSIFYKDTLSKKELIIYELLICFSLIVFATYRTEFMYMGDTSLYERSYNNISTNFNSFISNGIFKGEFGFRWLYYICKSIWNNVNFCFFIISLIDIGLISYVYKKYSDNYLLSMFVYILSGQYYAFVCNGTRQGIAISILFSSLPFIIKKKYIICFLFILIAWTFHHTAWLFIPFLFICNDKFLNIKTLLFSIFIIIVIFFVTEFSNFLIIIFGEDSKYGEEIQYYMNNGKGMNVLSFFFHSIPFFIAYIYRNKINEINNPLINFCGNISLISSFFTFLAVFAGGIMFGRIPGYFILFSYILLPWEIKYIYKNNKVVFFIIILFYLTYYILSCKYKFLLQQDHINILLNLI